MLRKLKWFSARASPQTLLGGAQKAPPDTLVSWREGYPSPLFIDSSAFGASILGDEVTLIPPC